jgi:transposase
VIVDKLSAHKTKDVAAFLEAHPRVHLHFTPTYSSWLNQVELRFAKVERDLLARGIFTSIPVGAQESAIHHSLQRRPEADPLDPQQSGHRITTDLADRVH